MPQPEALKELHTWTGLMACKVDRHPTNLGCARLGGGRYLALRILRFSGPGAYQSISGKASSSIFTSFQEVGPRRCHALVGEKIEKCEPVVVAAEPLPLTF
jgi:hypothetical protein